MGELDLLTLGSVDVEPAVLQGDGMALDELPLGPVEGIHPVDDRTPPDVRALLPARGWRVVHEAARGDGGSDVAFAAPVDGGWATLHLARRPDGRSILSGDPGPVVPRPGRPARRAGLALRWDAARALTTLADPAATATGPASRLTITLTNDSDRRWAADPRDNGFVVAGLLDADGARIGQAYFSFAPPPAPARRPRPPPVRGPARAPGRG
ncbi:MAG: hypothetical protein ACTHQ3_20815 [Motilibacteraceae bacterium]